MVSFSDSTPLNIATKVFKTNTPILSAIPRLKFNFYVEFILSNEASTMMNNANLNTWQQQRGISFKIKNVDKPKVTLETKELNQYNKKRLVYTNITYGDASIRLHDSVDDSVLAFWVDYFTYFFADSRSTMGVGGDVNSASNSAGFQQSPVAAQFTDGTGFGFRPISEQTLFFVAIRVWALFNQTYTRFSYINPRITSFDWHDHDSSSSDGEEVLINFKYEALQYEAFGQQLTSNDLQTIGLDPLVSNITADIPRQQPSIFTNTALVSALPDGSITGNQLGALFQSPNSFTNDPAFSPTLASNSPNVPTSFSSSITSSLGLIPNFG